MTPVELTIPIHEPVKTGSFHRKLAQFIGNDIAIDLGTANTLIYVKGRGVVLNEPSMLAIESDTNTVVAIGKRARDMSGRTTSEIRCERPLRDGVVGDIELATMMITYMLRQSCGYWLFRKPRAVVGIPCGITQVEKKAIHDAVLNSGCKSVSLVEEPMAAALGCNLRVDEPIGNMVVDIGGGTTEVAIISRCNTIYSHSIRVAGDEMDESIQRLLRKVYTLEIGALEAERLKLLLGTALPLGKPRYTHAYGRDLSVGRPQKIEISDTRIREALHEPIEAIVSSVSTALEQTNTEIAKDIARRGIYLTGGGALLSGLAERLYRETGVNFILAKDSLSCVARGIGRVVDNFKEMKVYCVA